MSEPTRRTVMVGAAWAVPVFAAAIATPLAAASQPTCEGQGQVHWYNPTDHGSGGGSMGPAHNVATIEVIVGIGVTVTFMKAYKNATAINIDGRIVKKWDNGAKPGDTFTHPLEPCCDPTFIQVDGNNTHYYGGGRFA